MFACITPALAFGSAAERTPVRIKKLFHNFYHSLILFDQKFYQKNRF